MMREGSPKNPQKHLGETEARENCQRIQGYQPCKAFPAVHPTSLYSPFCRSQILGAQAEEGKVPTQEREIEKRPLSLLFTENPRLEQAQAGERFNFKSNSEF